MVKLVFKLKSPELAAKAQKAVEQVIEAELGPAAARKAGRRARLGAALRAAAARAAWALVGAGALVSLCVAAALRAADKNLPSN